MSDMVSYGFQDVTPEEKTARVGSVFERVAQKYDVMNDLMSAGTHRLIKDRFVRKLRPRAGERILDMAGGTGDIAFRMVPSGADITVADINPHMLDVGRARAEKRGFTALTFAEQNAETLSFDSASFDAYSIAYGIRNVTDIPAALAEAYRVLRYGGRFMCLEFSRAEWPVFGDAYERITMKLWPRVGAVVAGDEEPYQYLVESIRKFPPMGAFAGMIREAGFSRVSATPIMGGVSAIHMGWKA
ncbi:class I SAM-dependent methyltransferase [Pacificimonas sp. WHA3]|uniref:Ubiquinone/menaquinone biosynthesis C-methyltransferase UbiE n=1 Tax=Pacificimonas pallii TaxID=2827236 RepID=A0ABS6SFZ3_9SPHN|nr:class I SAM-dependent methyltransferase [Pacificimonas pallii]MBV7257337.1 class I SAM-dependent methyltransferase [Pacificimonas pallii]